VKGVDTNVLVRYLTQDDPVASPLVSRELKASCSKEEPCLINAVVLCELVWVLETSYGYPRLLIADTLEKILETNSFRVQQANEAWSALGVYRNGRADFADAYIAVCNHAFGCEETLTLDKKAGRLKNMRLVTS
jgi:predicted nucleic-acid-binding protein